MGCGAGPMAATELVVNARMDHASVVLTSASKRDDSIFREA